MKENGINFIRKNRIYLAAGFVVALIAIQLIFTPLQEFLKSIFILTLSLTFFFSLLAVSYYFFSGIHVISSARWSENLTVILKPVSKTIKYLLYFWLIVIAFSGAFISFPENISSFRDFYFHPVFIYLRSILFLILLVKLSDIPVKSEKTVLSFIIVFFAFSIFAYDWLLAIPAHHEINILILLMIINSLQFGVGFVTLITLQKNTFKSVGNDLRKYLLSLSFAWAYLSFSYLLIGWYSLQTNETVFFKALFESKLIVLFVLNILLNFVIPVSLLLLKRFHLKSKSALIAVYCIFSGKFNDVLLIFITGFSIKLFSNFWLISATVLTGFVFLKYVIVQAIEKINQAS